MKKSSFFIVLMALAGLVVWGILQYDSGDEANFQKERRVEVVNQSEVNYDNDSISEKLLAYNLATDVIIKSLEEPTTAEFPNTEEKLKHIAYLGSNRYRINSWVDSRDTYGAMRRKKFSFIFKIDDSRVIEEEFMIEKYGYITSARFFGLNIEIDNLRPLAKISLAKAQERKGKNIGLLKKNN